ATAPVASGSPLSVWRHKLPSLGRLLLFHGVLFDIANRAQDVGLAIQEHLPFAPGPAAWHSAIGLFPRCQRVQVSLEQLARSVSLEQVDDLLDRISVTSNHCMHMLRKDAAGPDGHTGAFEEARESLTNGAGLQTRERNGRIG